MFEGVNDAALIGAMGDASRAESAAIAQRLGYDCYTASPGRWSIMVKALRVMIAGVASVSAFAVMAAAPAQADEETYLQRLLPRYTYLDPQQLLDEGYKVCEAERSGVPSPESVKRVYEDMGVSMTVALEIVFAALDDLGCSPEPA
ncbi:MAG TPA: hypothetical protein VFP27_05810 [Mycobacterium sp.]|nr:hypothetical protein [Mycobacterium sp.]